MCKQILQKKLSSVYFTAKMLAATDRLELYGVTSQTFGRVA